MTAGHAVAVAIPFLLVRSLPLPEAVTPFPNSSGRSTRHHHSRREDQEGSWCALWFPRRPPRLRVRPSFAVPRCWWNCLGERPIPSD